MIQGLKILIAIYTEFIGYELNIYMAALTHDENQISAFVSFINITGFPSIIGLGFGNISRRVLSNYVGEKKYIQAKNVQLFYLFLTTIVGIIFMILFISSSGTISKIYSDTEKIDFWLRNMIRIFSIGAVAEFMTGILKTTLRVANRTGTVAVIVSMTYVFELLLLSYLLGFVAHMKVLGLA